MGDTNKMQGPVEIVGGAADEDVLIVTDRSGEQLLLIGATKPGSYTVTNGTPDRAFDPTSTTLLEVGQVVAALIADLQALKLIG